MRTLLVTALLTASTLSIHTDALPEARPDGRVQVHLAGVLEVGEEDATLVVLRGDGTRTILPLLLPGDAGRALAAELESHRAPALLGVTLRALGAQVKEIQLEGSGEEVSGGHARVVQGPREVDVQGRPSDMVAVAVATGAPMYMDRRLFEAAGLTPQDIERARRRLERRDHQTWL